MISPSYPGAWCTGGRLEQQQRSWRWSLGLGNSHLEFQESSAVYHIQLVRIQTTPVFNWYQHLSTFWIHIRSAKKFYEKTPASTPKAAPSTGPGDKAKAIPKAHKSKPKKSKKDR